MSSPVASCVAETIVTVVVAGDHHIVRAGVRALLEADEDIEVVAEAADADAALRSVLGHKPDVVLLDLDMAGALTSLEAIPGIAERSPRTRVVVLTMQSEPGLARDAMQAGAAGYLLKDSADGELVEAVHRAAAGGTYVAPRLGAAMAALADEAGRPPGGLTPRELEVLRLIALGHTNAEIAPMLFLSDRTVESHRAHIHEKLRASPRAELVRYALDSGLLG